MTDGADRRAAKRHDLSLGVRFVTRADLEASGNVEDVSATGMKISTEAIAQIGDDVIAYPEGLGRITGTIVRKDKNGIAVEFTLSEHQREHLLKRISSALSGIPYLRVMDKRLQKRVTLNIESSATNLSTGDQFECEIVDFSHSGAAIRSKTCPPYDSEIKIGTMKGRVRRKTKDGFAIEFGKSQVA